MIPNILPLNLNKEEHIERDIRIIKRQSKIEDIAKYNKQVNNLIDNLSIKPFTATDMSVARHVLGKNENQDLLEEVK